MTPRETLLKTITRGDRRKRRDAARAVDIVLDEVLALVLPAVENQWGGNDMLVKLRALKAKGE